MSRRTIMTLACALWSIHCASTSSSSMTPAAEAPTEGPSRVAAVTEPTSSSPCQGTYTQHERGYHPQGSLLGNELLDNQQEMSSVLSSIDLGDVQLKDGHLDASPGTIFRGTSSNGERVEVALCDAEPQNDGTGVIWYHIELRTPQSASWFNPCGEPPEGPRPRALAMSGVWNERGAHEAQPGRFTFACETGAIAKCVDWGYRPWEIKDGRSMADLHQACTRMARADYCGDGHSHTRDGTIIDVYDVLRVQTQTQSLSRKWDPSRAIFDALWLPDGAACLAHPRNGKEVSDIIKECPDRFVMRPVDLGEGDLCVATRKNLDPKTAMVRNRIQQSNPTLGLRSPRP